MKLLIIDENGVREFTPTDAENQNPDETKSALELLKEKLFIEQNDLPNSNLNLFTISKLVALFDTTRPTIYSWIDNGDLIPIKIGGRVYFNQKDIELMLERKASESKLE
jgi:predicted DNA-binding transcriptional regulator AlpA